MVVRRVQKEDNPPIVVFSAALDILNALKFVFFFVWLVLKIFVQNNA